MLNTRALAHVKTLSLGGFRDDLQQAVEWSFSRAAKNRLRDVLHYVRDTEPASLPWVGNWGTWGGNAARQPEYTIKSGKGRGGGPQQMWDGGHERRGKPIPMPPGDIPVGDAS